MELLKDVLEEERRDSSCSNGCTTKMLTWLFVGHGLSVIGAYKTSCEIKVESGVF